MSNRSKGTKGAFGKKKSNGIKLVVTSSNKSSPVAHGKRRLKEMRAMGFRRK
jgi:hypothetical protein